MSVVVPTRNRAQLLPRLLDALAAQHGVGPFEVIVVDDSSTDDTRLLLERPSPEGGFTLRTLRTDRPRGAAAARNLGMSAARAPLIAFTDDDCEPQPGWLAAMVDALGRTDIVQGRTEWSAVAGADRGPFAIGVWVSEWSWQFETCNIGYRRELLLRLGGFDENFESDAYGEDIDLGWRALEQGARYAFIPGAFVYHDVKRSTRLRDFVASLRRTWRWRHIGRVVRDHPGYARRRLQQRVFLNGRHLPMLVALAGLSAESFLRSQWGLVIAAAGVLPWVVVRTTIDAVVARKGKYPLVLPLAFIVDAAEVAVTIGSAVRYRALAL